MSVAGTWYETGSVPGGICIRAVVSDRFQVSGCASFSTEAALTIPFSSIAYLGDDPGNDFVTIFLNRPLGR